MKRMKCELHIAKTVKEQIDLRCRLLFGVSYGDANTIQQDVCLMLFNLQMSGMGVFVVRTPNVVRSPPDAQSDNIKGQNIMKTPTDSEGSTGGGAS
jgi:hypothetical protein